MKLDVTFTETDQKFQPDFGEVFNVSDGGFERGYDKGYGEGETAGYDKGYGEGDTAGYDKGNTDGYAAGYDAGHTAGVESVEIYQTKYGVMYTPIFSVNNFGISYADLPKNILRGADKLVEATFGWPTVQGGGNSDPVSDSSVQRLYFPKLGMTNTYVARNCPNLVECVFGGIGYAVTSLYFRTFYGTTNNPDLVITVYVDASTLADIPTAVTGNLPGSATNATIIYRNSTTGEVITE